MAKRFFSLAIVIGVFAANHAQEPTASTIIVTEAGETIKASTVEIGESAIFYQAVGGASFERLGKDEILVIKYANGERWMPGQQNNTQKDTGQPQNNDSRTTTSFSDAALNQAAKERTSPDRVKFTGKPSDDNAGEVLLLYAPTEEAVLGDKNIEIVVKTIYPKGGWSGSRFYAPWVDVDLTNRSGQTIYIDLGNTYFVCGNDSYRYYTPTATTETNSSSTGIGVNLGGVTNALGIGGAAGALANATTVGGSSGYSTSTTTFSERVLAIPPKSSVSLKGGHFSVPEKIKESGKDYGSDVPAGYSFGAISEFGNGFITRLFYQREKKDLLTVGAETTDFDKSIFPAISFLTNYSTDETMANPVSIQSQYLPYRIMAAKNSKNGGIGYPVINDKDFSPEFKDCLYLFMRQRKK